MRIMRVAPNFRVVAVRSSQRMQVQLKWDYSFIEFSTPQSNMFPVEPEVRRGQILLMPHSGDYQNIELINVLIRVPYKARIYWWCWGGRCGMRRVRPSKNLYYLHHVVIRVLSLGGVSTLLARMHESDVFSKFSKKSSKFSKMAPSAPFLALRARKSGNPAVNPPRAKILQSNPYPLRPKKSHYIQSLRCRKIFSAPSAPKNTLKPYILVTYCVFMHYQSHCGPFQHKIERPDAEMQSLNVRPKILDLFNVQTQKLVRPKCH